MLTLGKKMFLLGGVAVASLLLLGSVTLYSNSRVEGQAQQLIKRGQQIEIINRMLQRQLTLMLAVMDAIVDKDEGRIAPERQREISDALSFLTSNLEQVEQLADTEEERREAGKVRQLYGELDRTVRQDLKRLIESRADTEQFARLDDMLDGQGGRITESLAAIQASVQAEVEEARLESQQILKRSSLLAVVGFLVALALIVGGISSISREVIGSVRGLSLSLSEGANQIAAASGEVASASQTLADGASQQAASVEQTSASMEQIAAMTRRDADNAQEANTIMTSTNEVIHEADGSMKKLTLSMAEITQASSETQKIVKTIDEIAFQTNLLALNAAVEAARAGEAGAGFAVVADEVRNLAMRAAEAARNTSQLIEGTVDKIKAGDDILSETSSSFYVASQSSGRIAILVAEIASSAREQAQAVAEVNKAIGEIDKITQSNAAAAEEIASAAEQLSAQAAVINGSAGELNRLAGSAAELRRPASPRRHQAASGRRASGSGRPHARPENPLSLPPGRGGHGAQPQARPAEVIPMDDDDFKDF